MTRMTTSGGSMSGLEDLRSLSVSVPLSQANELRRLFSEVPIKLPAGGHYRIEVSGSEVEVYGDKSGISRYRIDDSSKVQAVNLSGNGIELEVDSTGFSKIILHSELAKKSIPRHLSSSLQSSGESRGGFGCRASG